MTRDQAFERFWSSWPKRNGRRKGKAAAKKLFLEIDPSEYQAIQDGKERWERSERWQNGYIPDAETWLRNERWKRQPKQDTRARALGPRAASVSRQRGPRPGSLEELCPADLRAKLEVMRQDPVKWAAFVDKAERLLG